MMRAAGIQKVILDALRSVLIVFKSLPQKARNTTTSFANRRWNKIAGYLDDIDGPLQKSDLVQLDDLIRSLPTQAKIVEIYPGTGQVTCCLGAASWRSQRRIFSLWAEEAGDPACETGTKFTGWHKTILRKNLVPYISPVLVTSSGPIPSLPLAPDLVIFIHDPLFPEWNVADLEQVLPVKMSKPVLGIEYNASKMLSKYFPQCFINQMGNFYMTRTNPSEPNQ